MSATRASASAAPRGMISQEDAARLLAATMNGLTGVPPVAIGPPPPDAPVAPAQAEPPGLAKAFAPVPPYVTSPSYRRPEAGSAASPGPATADTSSPGQRRPGRAPVKGGPLRPVHTTEPGSGLADKLAAKRQALQPFGGRGPDAKGPVAVASSDQEANDHAAAAALQEFELSDGDIDLPGVETAPGLDGMG